MANHMAAFRSRVAIGQLGQQWRPTPLPDTLERMTEEKGTPHLVIVEPDSEGDDLPGLDWISSSGIDASGERDDRSGLPVALHESPRD